jgi:hypothetical protein
VGGVVVEDDVAYQVRVLFRRTQHDFGRAAKITCASDYR